MRMGEKYDNGCAEPQQVEIDGKIAVDLPAVSRAHALFPAG
jgi:hypothetical protein